MFHSKAVSEFEHGLLLERTGVKSISPILVVKYEGLNFEGAPMGAVASIAPDRYAFGLESILFWGVYDYPGVRDYFRGVARSLGIAGEVVDKNARFRVLSLVYQQIGGLCRSFSEAGLFRHSGGLNNFYFCRATGQVFLTDLDSSLRTDTLPPTRCGLEILRDLISIIHKLFLHFAILQSRAVAGLEELRDHGILV